MHHFESLLCVKSIITILLIGALVILSFLYPEEYNETLKSSVTMVVTFYFAHQTEKRNSQKGDEKHENSGTL